MARKRTIIIAVILGIAILFVAKDYLFKAYFTYYIEKKFSGDCKIKRARFSNIFKGPAQKSGIKILGSDNNGIYRNLFVDQSVIGICITNDADNINIINNTIYGSGTGDGIGWYNTTSGTMYNNIILSNGCR